MKIQPLCLGAMLVLATSSAYPRVYRFVDDQGMIVYSDRAPLQIRGQEQHEVDLPAPPSEAAIQAAEERENRLKAEAEKMANDRKERARTAQTKVKEAEKKPEGKTEEITPSQLPTTNTPVSYSP